jgi:hypothetical protein
MTDFEIEMLAILTDLAVSQQELASSVRVLADAVNAMKETPDNPAWRT